MATSSLELLSTIATSTSTLPVVFNNNIESDKKEVPLIMECNKCTQKFSYNDQYKHVRCPHCYDVNRVGNNKKDEKDSKKVRFNNSTLNLNENIKLSEENIPLNIGFESFENTEENIEIEQRYYDLMAPFKDQFEYANSALVYILRVIPTRNHKVYIPKNFRWPKSVGGEYGYSTSFRSLGLSLREGDTKSGHWHYWYLDTKKTRWVQLQRAIHRRWRESVNYNITSKQILPIDEKLPQFVSDIVITIPSTSQTISTTIPTIPLAMSVVNVESELENIPSDAVAVVTTLYSKAIENWQCPDCMRTSVPRYAKGRCQACYRRNINRPQKLKRKLDNVSNQTYDSNNVAQGFIFADDGSSLECIPLQSFSSSEVTDSGVFQELFDRNMSQNADYGNSMYSIPINAIRSF